MRLWVPTGITGSVAGLDREACMGSLLCLRFCQYCSNCTRWTPYSGVAALGVHGHFDFCLGWGWICSMQDLGKSKSFFAAACFGGGSWVRLVSRPEKLLRAGEVPAIQHVSLGLLVLLYGSSCNILARAISLPLASSEWVQRAVCHLQSPPDSGCQYIEDWKLLFMLGSHKGGPVSRGGSKWPWWIFAVCAENARSGSYGRKKNPNLSRFVHWRMQWWHHAVGCGARPAVPKERCRVVDKGFGPAWAVRDCQGMPVRDP